MFARTLAVIMISLLPCRMWAADQALPDLEPLIQAGQQWIEDNLDEQALAALGVDVKAFSDFARDLRKRLEADYVLDLAALRDGAQRWLPLLDSNEATQPYAAWLRSHLDDFEVANELRRIAPTNVPNWRPTPAQERKAWEKQLQRKAWPANATTWVTRLKPRFITAEVPSELVWLAEVESGFNPSARSPVGAVGMFQLMPATAKRFGLTVGWLRDDRKNADKSATAAATYLKLLHGQFKDWRLALAAYNCGEGRLADLMKKHKAKTFDAVARFLPAETQMYVPKVEATLLKREGAALQRLQTSVTPAKLMK